MTVLSVKAWKAVEIKSFQLLVVDTNIEEVWNWTRLWVDWVIGVVGRSSISRC